jgi:hypothetical protein
MVPKAREIKVLKMAQVFPVPLKRQGSQFLLLSGVQLFSNEQG